MKKFLLSKTVWAGIVGAIGTALNAETLDIGSILQAVSVALAGIGVKHAVDKSGPSA